MSLLLMFFEKTNRYVNGKDFFVKDFNDSINVTFATVSAEPTERVKSIINRLATARGL